MQLTLLGPGKIELHYQKFMNIKKEVLDQEIKNISKALADSGVEIDFLPDKGISLEIAKQYKTNKGKKVIGVVPKSDKPFGIKHLQQYIDSGLFDEIIDSGDWYKHDLTKALFGNAVLLLGKTPGTKVEMNGSIYLYYLMKGFKENIEVSLKKINPDLKAGNNYTFLIYSPFILGGKLEKEDELYLKEYEIDFIYIKDPDHLKKELIRLKKLF